MVGSTPGGTRQTRGFLVVRQLRADGCDTAVLWMLADNPSRFFYEGLGGERIGHRIDTMAGVDVEELAFAWRDLTVPLIRRKLATED